MSACVQMNVRVCVFAFLAGSHCTVHDPAKNSAKTQISGTVHDPRIIPKISLFNKAETKSNMRLTNNT